MQHRTGGHPHAGGVAVEEFDLKQLQETCWRDFCGVVNHNIQQGRYTGELTVKFQDADCRIMECQPDGTCVVDVPGGEPQTLGLKPEDCTRLLAVCCNIPPNQMASYGGGQQMKQ